MARDLRQALAAKGHVLSHGACLELVARQFGLADWNTLSALITRIDERRQPLPAADGWHPTGMTDPTKFRMGLDPRSPGVALIECLADPALDARAAEMFGCLMQSVSAERYRGQRLKLSAQIRGEEAGLGSLWLRVDNGAGTVLRFDNMLERTSDGPISGTTEWISRTIVLDIPAEAASVHYGFFLKGHGQMRARIFDLEPVDAALPTTEITPVKPRRALPRSRSICASSRAGKASRSGDGGRIVALHHRGRRVRLCQSPGRPLSPRPFGRCGKFLKLLSWPLTQETELPCPHPSLSLIGSIHPAPLSACHTP
ncbi:glyoxalase superfamily protein [Bosea sp. BIWAKO-01]|uniref:glyoxalase superfamily protein n=1 Tax=Bosea sp. BIWAKO-01 TaxID=506668 RepID=UPI0008537128|nr:glyoxalase superfamily protein [Bosea sp. BIWAKO-01]